MGVFDDATDLILHGEGDFAKIRQAYDASLHAKAVSRTLRVQIKNLVENLRSALDCAGRGLFDRYGSSSKASPKIYFPWPTGRAAGAALLTWTTDTPTVPGL